MEIAKYRAFLQSFYLSEIKLLANFVELIAVKMKNLYLFNPETEMALASDSAYYMAPQRIIQMKEDLEMLPLWYSNGGTIMVSNSINNREWMKNQIELFNLKPSDLIDFNREKSETFHLMPWGWNRKLIKDMEERGAVLENQLSEEGLFRYREMSSRRYVAEKWSMEKYADLDGVVGWRKVATELHECVELMKKQSKVLFKAVWSGSGRGLRWAEGMDAASVNWCRRMLKNQGALIVEGVCRKVIDFAMEFEVGDNARFIGYSLFKTNRYGAYLGNLLASQREIEHFLERYINQELLDRVKEKSMDMIDSLFLGKYCGIMGIDMMICTGENSEYLLHPLVEVNLRMNMGVVSLKLYERLLKEKSVGYYLLEAFNSHSELRSDDESLRKLYPAVFEDNRIQKGYHSLTPIGENTLYRASVRVYDEGSLPLLYEKL